MEDHNMRRDWKAKCKIYLQNVLRKVWLFSWLIRGIESLSEDVLLNSLLSDQLVFRINVHGDFQELFHVSILSPVFSVRNPYLLIQEWDTSLQTPC